MIVGLLTLELHVTDSASLKDKRRIVRGVYDRIRHRFNVSIAEVGGHDTWQRTTLAVACVTTDTRQAHRVLSTVAEFIDRQRSVELIDHTVELF